MKPLLVACVMMGFHSLRYQQLMPINLHYLLQKLRDVLSNLEKQVCPSAMYAVSYMTWLPFCYTARTLTRFQAKLVNIVQLQLQRTRVLFTMHSSGHSSNILLIHEQKYFLGAPYRSVQSRFSGVCVYVTKLWNSDWLIGQPIFGFTEIMFILSSVIIYCFWWSNWFFLR